MKKLLLFMFLLMPVLATWLPRQCGDYNVTTGVCEQTIQEVDTAFVNAVRSTPIPFDRAYSANYVDYPLVGALLLSEDTNILWDGKSAEDIDELGSIVVTKLNPDTNYEEIVPIQPDYLSTECHDGFGDYVKCSPINNVLGYVEFYFTKNGATDDTYYIYLIPDANDVTLFYPNDTYGDIGLHDVIAAYPNKVSYTTATNRLDLNTTFVDFASDYSVTNFGSTDAGAGQTYFDGDVFKCLSPDSIFVNGIEDPTSATIEAPVFMELTLVDCDFMGQGAGTGSITFLAFPNQMRVTAYPYTSFTDYNEFLDLDESNNCQDRCASCSANLGFTGDLEYDYENDTGYHAYDAAGEIKDIAVDEITGSFRIVHDGSYRYTVGSPTTTCAPDINYGLYFLSDTYDNYLNTTDTTYGREYVTQQACGPTPACDTTPYNELKSYGNNPYTSSYSISYVIGSGKTGGWADVDIFNAVMAAESGEDLKVVPMLESEFGGECESSGADWCESILYDSDSGVYIGAVDSLECQGGFLGYEDNCGVFHRCLACGGTCSATYDEHHLYVDYYTCGSSCVGVPYGYYCGIDNNRYLNTSCGDYLHTECVSGSCEEGACVGGVDAKITVMDTDSVGIGSAYVQLDIQDGSGYSINDTTNSLGVVDFNLPEGVYNLTLIRTGYTNQTGEVAIREDYFGGCRPIIDGQVYPLSCKFIMETPDEATESNLVVTIIDEFGEPLPGVTVNFTSDTESFEGFTGIYGKYWETFDPANETITITMTKGGYVPQTDSIFLATGSDRYLTYELEMVEDITVEGNLAEGSRFFNGKALLKVTPPITGTMSVIRQDVIAYRCADSSCQTYKPMTFIQPVLDPETSSAFDEIFNSGRAVDSLVEMIANPLSPAILAALGPSAAIGQYVAIYTTSAAGDLLDLTESRTLTGRDFYGRPEETINVVTDAGSMSVNILKNFADNSTQVCGAYGDTTRLMIPNGFSRFLTDYLIFTVDMDEMIADFEDNNVYTVNIGGVDLKGKRINIKSNPLFSDYLRRGYPSFGWMRGYEAEKFVKTIDTKRVTADTEATLSIDEQRLVGDIYARIKEHSYMSVEPGRVDKPCNNLALEGSDFKVVTTVTLRIDGDDGSVAVINVPVEGRASNVNWFAPNRIMLYMLIVIPAIPILLALLFFLLILILG